MKSVCFLCGKLRSASGKNMKTCTRCKCAIYCSEGCHMAHWKKDGGHKTKCRKIHALNLKMTGSTGVSAGESKTHAGDGAAGPKKKPKNKKNKKKKKKRQ